MLDTDTLIRLIAILLALITIALITLAGTLNL